MELAKVKNLAIRSLISGTVVLLVFRGLKSSKLESVVLMLDPQDLHTKMPGTIVGGDWRIEFPDCLSVLSVTPMQDRMITSFVMNPDGQLPRLENLVALEDLFGSDYCDRGDTS